MNYISKIILNMSSISCNLASKIMTLAFVFLPFVFMNLLRQIFVSIKNLSYDNCRDKPMSTLLELHQQSWPLYRSWRVAAEKGFSLLFPPTAQQFAIFDDLLNWRSSIAIK